MSLFIPKDPINNIPALAWHWPCHKPLSEPMMGLFTNTYVSFGLNELKSRVTVFEILCWFLMLFSVKVILLHETGPKQEMLFSVKVILVHETSPQ